MDTDTSNTPKTNHLNLKIAGILLFLVSTTLFVYHGINKQGFTNFDDRIYVIENNHINQGFSKENIIWAFKPMKTD